MGTASVAAVFLVALVLSLIVRPILGRSARAGLSDLAATRKDRSGSTLTPKITRTGGADEDAKSLPGVIIATLAAQKAFVSSKSGALPERARDRFSIGYIGGYTDAILQLKSVQKKAVAQRVADRVFAGIFNSDDGPGLYQRYLELNLAGDPEVVAGKHIGDSDIMSWLRNNRTVPLGWSDHVLGQSA